jgi:hypothetical protein
MQAEAGNLDAGPRACASTRNAKKPRPIVAMRRPACGLVAMR